VNWVSLGGIIGLAPIASMGPLSVGPGPVERSCLTAPAGVSVYLDPLALIMGHKVRVRVRACVCVSVRVCVCQKV